MKILGYVLVGVFCVFNVLTSEYTQYVDKIFDAPYFVRYVNMCEMLSLFLVIQLWKWRQRERVENSFLSSMEDKKYLKPMDMAENDSQLPLNIEFADAHESNSPSSTNSAGAASVNNNIDASSEQFFCEARSPISDVSDLAGQDAATSAKAALTPVHMEPIRPNSYKTFLTFSCLSAVFLGIGGVTLYIAMDSITVPTAVALSGLRAPCCYVLQIFFHKEPLLAWKVLALLFSIAGVLSFVLELRSQTSDTSDSGQTHDTLGAIVLLVICNCCIACNDVTIKTVSNKTYNSENKLIGSLYLVSYQGVWTMIIGVWTLWYPWNMFSEQNSEQLFDGNAWFHVLVLGIVLMLSNIVAFVGMAVTSPVFINVGVLLSIPLSFVVDIFVHDYVVTFWSVAGAALLVSAFLMLEIIKPPKWCRRGSGAEEATGSEEK